VTARIWRTSANQLPETNDSFPPTEPIPKGIPLGYVVEDAVGLVNIGFKTARLSRQRVRDLHETKEAGISRHWRLT
jgi:hypothetical protein